MPHEMAAQEQLNGYLVVKVLEASGKSKEDEAVWDSSLRDGYIKIEVRGGPRTVKKQTTVRAVEDGMIVFEEQLALEILEGAKELRIMLCRQKRTEGRTGTSVIAACGIFVNDILEAVPIDKFFDLFKPGAGAEGGFVRVSMSFVPPDEVYNGHGGADVKEIAAVKRQPGKRQGQSQAIKLVAMSALVALGGLVLMRLVGKPKPIKQGEGGSNAARSTKK